jgi:hypothetical protein
MKMPERRYFPTELPPDVFGLRPLCLLSEAGLTGDERHERVAKIEAYVAEAFKDAVRQLGEDEARKLFGRVLRKPKRGGAKVLAPDRDHQLLTAYDNRDAAETVTALATRLHARGISLGNSVGAIIRQIQRLVKEREERYRRDAAESRYMRMAMRHQPPSLLSAARSAK